MAKKKIKYEDAISQIEGTLTKIRNSEISLDELTAEIKRATELIEQCRTKLQDVEAEVKSVIER